MEKQGHIWAMCQPFRHRTLELTDVGEALGSFYTRAQGP